MKIWQENKQKMTILEEIINYKKKEVEKQKSLVLQKELETMPFYKRTCFSLKEHLKNGSGVIAEFKRKSPSKGIINDKATVEQCTVGYAKAGASALSILTDTNFFAGKSEDLTKARPLNNCPILRKDFMISEYQVIEAKAIGADTILLIAAVLSQQTQENLAKLAHNLGLEVLLEVHSLEEIQNSAIDTVDVVGVNNRNLKTFKTSLENSLNLIQYLPKDKVKISESGISKPEDAILLRKAGFDGFLIGELFMRANEPDVACKAFIEKL